jgi:tetratricopeptide (TPR) repeat protein
MRLALVISSAYAENTVVPCREAFVDTATLFAEHIGVGDAGFAVRKLVASRELPETIESLLREEPGKIESLLVYFSGYVAVKNDRGPALLLDGSRLRAFPLSRLRAAIEEGAQQTFVIIDALSVVDSAQRPPEVSKAVSEALASAEGSVSSLVGIEEEFPTTQRGARRLTDLFTLALSYWANKSRGTVVTSTAVYQAMQGDVLSFSNIPGLEHRPGYFDFVLLEGPQAGGVVELHFGIERATQPVATFQPSIPTDPGAQPQRGTGPALQHSFVEPSEQKAPGGEDLAESHLAECSNEGLVAQATFTEPERITPAPVGLRNTEGRCPTLAETPQARAVMQREWLTEAAYYPSAPPPKVSPVPPLPHLYPQGTTVEDKNDESRAQASRPSLQPNPEIADSSNAAIALYEELLDNLESSEDPRRAEVHAKLGDALRDTQRRAEALFAYERALDVDPLQETAFDGACSLYREDRDFAGLVSTIRRRLDATDDEATRLALHDLVIYVWLNEAQDYRRAIDAIEERLAITPNDVRTLERLIEAEDRLNDLFGRLESRERLAKVANANVEQRATLWLEAAYIAQNEIEDFARTYLHLESAIELGVKVREALEATEALLGGRDRWLEVIELYERALEVVHEPELAGFVGIRLTQLVLTQSAQDALKPETLSLLLGLATNDHALAEAVGALVQAQTVGPETVDAIQRLRESAPRNAALLHHLFRLVSNDNPDVAANIANVLCADGAATNEELEYARLLATDSLPNPQRALENADYDSLLFPPDFDRDMAFSLDQLDHILINADAFVLKSGIQLPKDTTILDPETSTVTLARSFRWTSQLLSVAVPELAILADAPALLRLILDENRPRIIVSKSLASGFTLPELAFLAARHSTLLLPGFAIRDHSADPRMLATALYVLGAIANGSSRGLKTLGEYEQKLGKRLLAELDKHPQLANEIDRLVGNVTASPADCEARAWHWLRAVDQIRLRVALLACGNPSIALKLTREYPLDGPWTAEEQLDLIAAFAGSPEHCELRSRLGMTQTAPSAS